MSPEERFSALADADRHTLEALADEILAMGSAVNVTAGPESVSAPIRVRVAGTEDTTTVLGHLAMTRCSILLGGHRGDGLRSGHDQTGAVAAAVCDAECERSGPLSERVLELCRTTELARARQRRRRNDVVAQTRLGDL